MTITLTAINRFPVKSCAAVPLTSALVERWGLAGDRRWMVVDAEGNPVTAREHPRMVLTRALPTPDGLSLDHPDLGRLDVRTPTGAARRVNVWGAELDALPAGPAADAWFSKIIGAAVRLVHLADPTQRQPNPRFSEPADRVSFADAYPMLLANESSLDALNAAIATGPRPAEGPVPMARFRPSLVVAGAPAWAEDGWRRLRIGAATFRAVKGSDRCVLTTVDPDTAAKNKEPLTTLARIRRWDGKTWFAMNLVPDDPGATVSVGDEVEILHAVPAPDGPPR